MVMRTFKYLLLVSALPFCASSAWKEGFTSADTLQLVGEGYAKPDLPQVQATAMARERVFERFARATLQGDGCGLGLAIVREIVERHAGHVALHAVAPRGLLARVTLPAIKGD